MFNKFRVGSGTLKSRSSIRIRNKILPDPQHCNIDLYQSRSLYKQQFSRRSKDLHLYCVSGSELFCRIRSLIQHRNLNLAGDLHMFTKHQRSSVHFVQKNPLRLWKRKHYKITILDCPWSYLAGRIWNLYDITRNTKVKHIFESVQYFFEPSKIFLEHTVSKIRIQIIVIKICWYFPDPR